MYTMMLEFSTMRADGWCMSKTSNARNISDFVRRLSKRKQALVHQLNLREMQDSRLFLQGGLSAIDEILHELIYEFGLTEEKRYLRRSVVTQPESCL